LQDPSAPRVEAVAFAWWRGQVADVDQEGAS